MHLPEAAWIQPMGRMINLISTWHLPGVARKLTVRRRSWFSSITCVILLRMVAISPFWPLRDNTEVPSPLVILSVP